MVQSNHSLLETHLAQAHNVHLISNDKFKVLLQGDKTVKTQDIDRILFNTPIEEVSSLSLSKVQPS